jgi:anhydro-N-acetylmuramic acid kinase
MKEYHVLGLMSGTSLDGLDIAYCTFSLNKGKWYYSIKKADTVKYDKKWYSKLRDAHQLSSEELIETHAEYGKFLGKKVSGFIGKHSIKRVNLVSSHGHTVFHNPERGYTFQLGNGASLAATCGINVICDFRVSDIALQGQGAPLVPIGDRLLFSEYDFCLNLGGYSNISYESDGNRIAFDICPVNTALNHLAQTKGKSYDKGGMIAKSGKVHKELLDKLNAIGYYKKNRPKSLGREWLGEYFLPVIDSFPSPATEDKLATVTEHAAYQIGRTILNASKAGSVLVTGGGAFNDFLISKLRQKLPGHRIIVPESSLVNFKEALVFAFLGVLKSEQRINTLKSVTGAVKDTSGGVLFTP